MCDKPRPAALVAAGLGLSAILVCRGSDKRAEGRYYLLFGAFRLSGAPLNPPDEQTAHHADKKLHTCQHEKWVTHPHPIEEGHKHRAYEARDRARCAHHALQPPTRVV